MKIIITFYWRCIYFTWKVSNKEKEDNKQDDDSDGGWSDDDHPNPQSNKSAVLSAGEKLPSGVVVKKAVRIFWRLKLLLFKSKNLYFCWWIGFEAAGSISSAARTSAACCCPSWRSSYRHCSCCFCTSCSCGFYCCERSYSCASASTSSGCFWRRISPSQPRFPY